MKVEITRTNTENFEWGIEEFNNVDFLYTDDQRKLKNGYWIILKFKKDSIEGRSFKNGICSIEFDLDNDVLNVKDERAK